MKTEELKCWVNVTGNETKIGMKKGVRMKFKKGMNVIGNQQRMAMNVMMNDKIKSF